MNTNTASTSPETNRLMNEALQNTAVSLDAAASQHVRYQCHPSTKYCAMIGQTNNPKDEANNSAQAENDKQDVAKRPVVGISGSTETGVE
jgi:hypothetical protein